MNADIVNRSGEVIGEMQELPNNIINNRGIVCGYWISIGSDDYIVATFCSPLDGKIGGRLYRQEDGTYLLE